MKVADARRMLEEAGGLKGLEEKLGQPLSDFHHDCHNGSGQVLRTGIFGPGRVARGFAEGVLGQHSWIVIGSPRLDSWGRPAERPDPYDPGAVVIDPTLWSYQKAEPYVHFAKNTMKTHVPHGAGSIWTYGRPDNCAPEAAVELAWEKPPSPAARAFMEALGPLDRKGWVTLAHYPVQDWPAGEIIGAVADTFGSVQVPVDILGMVTDRNPGGLYW